MPGKSTAVDAFLESSRVAEIHKLMIHGLSVPQIAEKLGTTDENIYTLVNRQKLRLTAGIQEAQEQQMAMTYARTEWLISKVFPVLEKQSDTDAGPDKNLLKVALDIMKFQTEALNPKNMDKMGNPDVVINQTFVAGSNMYDEAMKEMQNNFLQEIKVEREMPMTIQASPEMVRIEELAKRHLPKGFEDDRESDE